jgi:hypothetical protein
MQAARRIPRGKPKKTKKKSSRGQPARRAPLAARLAITFEPPLADEVRRAAELQTDGNVSAWLAKAARDHLRKMHARDAVAAHLAEHGPFPPEIIEEGHRQWPRD